MAPRMLSFDLGAGRFQVRAAAIIRREGHVLVHRARGETHWALPGGRIDLGEDAETTVIREIGEEMGCAAVAGPLHFVTENFFTYEGFGWQEIGFYFGVEIDGDFPFRTDDICHRSSDGNAELEFRWMPADEATLTGIDFKPEQLRSRLAGDLSGVQHLVFREEDAGA